MKLGDLNSGDIAKMAIKDDDIRLFKTPFGEDGGSYVLGKTVPWAGADGMDELRETAPEVADGLENAHEVNDAAKRMPNEGVVVVDYPGGKKVTMPRHAYNMMKVQNKDVDSIDARPSSSNIEYDEKPDVVTSKAWKKQEGILEE